MRRRSFVAILVPLITTAALADDGDDTLKFYLGKSDAIVVATLQETPSAVSKEAGVISYYCSAEVTQVLKGDAVLKGKLNFEVVRFEIKESPLPLKKGLTCIFCLSTRDSGKSWSTVDPWIGLLPNDPAMARGIARLAIESKKEIAK